MTSSPSQIASDMELLADIANQAGKIAMSFFGKKNEVWIKSGNSPVSQADFAVDAFLKQKLLEARPDYGWLSEETEDSLDRLDKPAVFVADPIDGTRGFLAGHKQWCISIAVVTQNRPVAGVLECPALGETYLAGQGTGAFCNGSAMSQLNETRISTVTASRKLNEIMEEQFAERLQILPFVPSLAYRLAMVAGAGVDAAFARPGAHDWDLAAGDILLQEVGGYLCDLNGAPRSYNLESSRSGSLIAGGLPARSELMRLVKTGGFLQ